MPSENVVRIILVTLKIKITADPLGLAVILL